MGELLQLVEVATGFAGVLQLVAARILGGGTGENAIRLAASSRSRADKMQSNA